MALFKIISKNGRQENSLNIQVKSSSKAESTDLRLGGRVQESEVTLAKALSPLGLSQQVLVT